MPTHMVTKKVGEYTLVGFSLAGEETTVGLPELNVCFDAGRAPREIISIDNLCVSHGHMDHAAGVPYYFSQRHFVGAPPGRVIVHRDLAQAFQGLQACWADIEGYYSPADIVGVSDGDEVPLRRNVVIRAFDVNHGRCALGFSVIERRHKLRPEYAGYTGPQLVELKKKGVSIEYHTRVPLVAYVGDTCDGAFFDADYVADAHLVIMECTFVDPAHLSRAQAGNHIHVRDLPRILSRVRSPNIVLTHLTRRTDLRSAKRIIRETLSARDWERVTLLMDRAPRPRRGKPPIPSTDEKS